MENELTYPGGCACGAIRYELLGKPAFVFMCRCRDCQSATGSAYAPNAWFPFASVNFRRGTPKAHVVIGGSGKSVYHEFCEACGSPVGMRSEAYPDFRAVRVASMDSPDLLKPIADVWTGSKIGWDPMHPSASKYAGGVPEKDLMEMMVTG